MRGKRKSGEASFDSLENWVAGSTAIIPDNLLKFSRRFLAPDFDRRIELIMRRYHGGKGDPFGFNFHFAVYVLIVLGIIYRYYFRVRMTGQENIPPGKCILVANHSGQIPIDGAMIALGLMLDKHEPLLLRSMYEKWAATLPFVSSFFSRCGQIVGRPENLKRLLGRGETVLAFPEGVKAITKPYSRAYTLGEFGMGFMRLALEHGCPIVPVAVIGAEEQYPSVANLERLARVLKMPGFPLPVQVFIPILGLLPLPSKYRITIGKPLSFSGDPDEEDSVMAQKTWAVKHTIQLMLMKGLKERRHIFW